MGLLIGLYFILALGFVFVQSMAFGIFLTEYGVQGLPYSYITVAILASLLAAHEEAYSLMLFAQRRQIHRAMAELLEGTIFSVPPYAEIAHHWKAADEIQKAVQYLERAGEHAREMGNYEEATRFFNESLGLNG